MTDSLMLKLRMARPRLYRVVVGYGTKRSEVLILDFDLAGVEAQVRNSDRMGLPLYESFSFAVPVNPAKLSVHERWLLHERYPDWFDNPYTKEEPDADDQ